MSRAMSQRSALLSAAIGTVLVGALALVSASASADETVNKRAPADAAGHVEVSNVAGSVTVSGWNRNEVEVTGELGDGVERLDFTSAAKLTRIKVILPKSSHRSGGSDLVIRVPAGSSLAIGTLSADVEIAGVTGAQRLQSVSGDLRTDAGREDVECKTVSGDVTVSGRGERGLLTITTVSGDALVDKVSGEVNANTVSGNIDLRVAEANRSRLRSTSGDLTLAAALPADARVDAETISGDVRLDLRGPLNADFEVSSFNGDIRNCFGPKAARTNEYAPGQELRFRQGTGSGRVRIKTMNGDIELCKK